MAASQWPGGINPFISNSEDAAQAPQGRHTNMFTESMSPLLPGQTDIHRVEHNHYGSQSLAAS
jgi:hypothetical protein